MQYQPPVENTRAQYSPASFSAVELERLARAVREVHHEVKGKMSIGKKIAVTLGITFLSACTARYWINKLEPVIEDYVIRHRAATQEQQTVPTSSHRDYSDLDAILEGKR